MTISELNSRIQKSAKLLNIKGEDLLSYLESVGISNDDFGIQLLEAETTTDHMIKHSIEFAGTQGTDKSTSGRGFPAIRLAAAVSILRGKDPFAKKEIQSPSTGINNYSGIEQAMKNSIPIANRKNSDLLEEFVKEEDIGIQQELDRRSNGKPFIVLDQSEKIRLDLSLDLLKKACRGDDIPDMIPVGQDRVAVYPIQSFRKENRIREESPFVTDSILFNGYCDKTDTDFSNIGENERKFIRLVVDLTNSPEYKNSKFHAFSLKSYSDKKALLASAEKGIQDLRKTWPSVARIYDERLTAGTLPPLKIVNPIVRKKSDPFHSNGNKTY